jgi:hypothetical protein
MPGQIPRRARVHTGRKRHPDAIAGSGPSGDGPSGGIKYHDQTKAYGFEYVTISLKLGLLPPKHHKLSGDVASELGATLHEAGALGVSLNDSSLNGPVLGEVG